MAANNRRMSGKKGAQVGSGGQRRRGLEGKGPTPPAEMRKGHKKNRIAGAKAKQIARRPAAPRGRGGKGTSEMVVGRNSVVEALREGVPASMLYVQQFIDNDERVREALQLAGERGGIHLMEAPRPELDRMTNGLNHQGLVLQVPPYEYAHPEDLAAAAYDEGQDPLIVALDGVTDPRNLGAVVRSVSAFGGHGVVVPERRAAGMTAGAWKTSAGAAARTPVARAANLTRALESYKKAGLVVVGLAADGEVEVGDLEALGGPVVIVVGSEGKGLSRLVGETCDFRVRIPMPGGTESLNAGVAAGVVLYEASRRRV
ncbi:MULTISPECIES: 23S rRNA (guanosine(2251)-2'-O)-methyltransferase RlmB [Streptomyces]|jgi:23S rRNA (guanosine2251-2'-O)-methyltransferase|uniref:23S rRNA (Guanosine(2251)-2'-O)-methyltransferase RlmB n=1 Tax=Streptomyces mirabilis TaxID=68239 RepID=A0ABU3URF1_9ACTN|nr:MULTISPECIES: 23S rRNA (guanosine(2251)-2'-O)-methyltransferase RlmB [Streptomyces]KPI10102.1 RNA methyltransferase, TrmH family, group 3 [Actinobacteria bacterium OK006]MCX4423241.1 23S rRNA (guanosine(2251)-2'-O)-methyltransferase RlmB [Streptomyces mirabilis]MCX4609949.1 23S rRNA (guanosine(2251)-2'-O)-methyltransferase RlmB [Streptomyces mirabilis]MCX5350186.1 23S rRNA (guanosine(2251)-2'-O)-methyltransferase RlmB [Streptomyces mirabilis]MDU8996398.1 23S rRNA (guanosine(2251)-2'-O)-meth